MTGSLQRLLARIHRQPARGSRNRTRRVRDPVRSPPERSRPGRHAERRRGHHARGHLLLIAAAGARSGRRAHHQSFPRPGAGRPAASLLGAEQDCFAIHRAGAARTLRARQGRTGEPTASPRIWLFDHRHHAAQLSRRHGGGRGFRGRGSQQRHRAGGRHRTAEHSRRIRGRAVADRDRLFAIECVLGGDADGPRRAWSAARWAPRRCRSPSR